MTGVQTCALPIFHLRSGDLRPLIELEPTDYPLAVEQRNGITLDRIKQIAAAGGHGP